jgi:hypothetical protein
MNARSSFARNVVSNWAVLSGHLAYGLLMTPIIVGALGSELYGVWSFLSGLVTYTELLYF